MDQQPSDGLNSDQETPRFNHAIPEALQPGAEDDVIYEKMDDIAGRLQNIGSVLPWNLLDNDLIENMVGEAGDKTETDLADALRQLQILKAVEDNQETFDSLFEIPELQAEIASDNPHENATIFMGRFELREAIGRGSYGIVYRAYDRITEREVALKLPRPELRGLKTVSERFHREGASVSDVVHPGLVPLLDIGVTDEMQYLVTRLVNGPNLEQWLAQANGPIPTSLAAMWTKQLAETIEHLHVRKILHCDLKPSNILLEHPYAEDPATLPPEHLAIRVTDFGSASRFSMQHQPQQAQGTICYMAPEQLQPGATIDARTDIYAICAIFYELITGQPVFQSQDSDAFIQEIFHQKPVPPRAIRPAIPVEIEAIILKGLEKRPEDRYQSAGELALDVQACMDMRSPQVLKSNKWRRAELFLRRNRIMVAAIFSISVIALAYAFYTRETNRALHKLEVERVRLNWWNNYVDSIEIAQKYMRANSQERLRQTLDSIRSWPAEAQKTDDPREFAWYYLNHELQDRSRLVQGLPDRVRHYTMAASPATGTIWTAGEDGSIREISTVLDRVIRTIPVKPGVEINSIACSADGKYIAVSYEAGTVQLIDAHSLKLVNQTKYHTREVVDLLFTNDSKKLISSGLDGRLNIWDFHAGTKVSFEDVSTDPKIPSFALRGLVMMPDGEHVAVGTSEHKIKIIRIKDGHNDENLLGHFDEVEQLTVTPDGDWLISASKDRTIGFWNLKTRKLQNQISMDESVNLLIPSTQLGIRVSKFSQLACVPEIRGVAVDVGQGHIQLYDIPSGNKIDQLTGHSAPVWSLIRQPWDGKLASMGRDFTMRIWEPPYATNIPEVFSFDLDKPADGPETVVLAGHVQGPASYIEGGQRLVSEYININDQFKSSAMTSHAQIMGVITANIADKGSKIIYNRFAVRRSSRNTGPMAEAALEPWKQIFEVKLEQRIDDPKLEGHPTEPYFLMTDGDQKLYFVNLTQWDSPKYQLLADQVTHASFIPSTGDVVVLRRNQEKQLFWNHQTGQWKNLLMNQPQSSKNWIMARISPDEKKLAIYQTGGFLQIWDIKTSTRLREILIPELGERRARDIAWTPDSRQIAIAMGMKDIQLIDYLSGKTIISWDIGFRSCKKIRFSADGQSLWLIVTPTDFDRDQNVRSQLLRFYAPRDTKPEPRHLPEN